MPVPFFAILTQSPLESAWFSSSHASHSLAEANASCGRPSSVPNARVGQLEVDHPGAVLLGSLPPALDPVAVIGEPALEALPERERREVGGVAPQLPHPVLEAHLVDARDP